MSFFGVTIEHVGAICNVPNSDFIDVVKPFGKDIQGIVGRDQYKVDDPFLLIPLDSIVPEPILIKLNLSGKLNGKLKNRVSTKLFRGALSQCLIAPMSLIDGLEDHSPEAITTFLGITKYDPPEVPCSGGVLKPLPEFCHHYDIESCDRYTEIVQDLLDKPCYITEKVEGTNFSISYDVVNDRIYVNQRNHTIEENGKENMYWRCARKLGLEAKIQQYAKDIGAQQHVSIYGEMIGPGIQGNLYKLNESTVMAFDVKVDGKWLQVESFLNVAKVCGMQHVPILSMDLTLRAWLNGKSVKEASTGASQLLSTIYREGIVIKPMEETYSQTLSGRLFLKQRSPEYLMADPTKVMPKGEVK